VINLQTIWWLTFAALAGSILIRPATALGDVVSTADRARWSYGLSAALDNYIQTYPLATSDTTETITEFNTAATLEGQSARRARHRWRARADLVAGSELFRQRLEAHYF